MPEDTVDDLRLGYLAITAEYINLAELKWCLQVQAESAPPPPLGKVLVREGYLSQRDLEYLHMIYAARKDKKEDPPDPLLMADDLSIERIERAVVARLGRALKSGVFGRFKVLGQIGRGGMGVVLRAQESDHEEEVALKLLVGSGGATVKDIERFKKEAFIMKQVVHENIVQIFDIGREKGLDYIAMEYIAGQNLAELLDERIPTVDESLSIAHDMCGALHFIHKRGSFHRDLKPANIMLEDSGRAVLMDFGLAVFDKVEVRGPKTGSVGTPQYQPPEQAEVGGRFGKICAASDVYGLGATLYHLLTGSPPFEGTDRAEIRRMVLTVEPRTPRSLNPRLPIDIEALVLKAIAKHPEQRFATPLEMQKAIDRIIDRRERGGRGGLPPRPPKPPPKRGWFG